MIEGHEQGTVYDLLSEPSTMNIGDPLATQEMGSVASELVLLTVPPHPLGIRPAGNAYVADETIWSAMGSFARLPEDVLVQILEHFSAEMLKHMGFTCKALYAFTRIEELWKTLLIL